MNGRRVDNVEVVKRGSSGARPGDRLRMTIHGRRTQEVTLTLVLMPRNSAGPQALTLMLAADLILTGGHLIT